MLEKIKYINHMMEEMVWGESGIFVNYNDLREGDIIETFAEIEIKAKL